MTKACQRCGKSAMVGINSSHKHSGAWAMRAPDSRKVWKPNLQTLRVKTPTGWRKMTFCIKCYRIVKATQDYRKIAKVDRSQLTEDKKTETVDRSSLTVDRKEQTLATA